MGTLTAVVFLLVLPAAVISRAVKATLPPMTSLHFTSVITASTTRPSATTRDSFTLHTRETTRSSFNIECGDGNGTACPANSTCTDGECVCQQGYYWDGTVCIEIDCAENPCLNGDCTEENGVSTCECWLGYNGTLCETEIDECLSNPCMNDAFCNNGIGSYTCDCLAGFTGTFCETDTLCPNNECLNGGQCNSTTQTCMCRDGFIGEYCQLGGNCGVDELPCLNGGVCQFDKCACSRGFSGVYCEIDTLCPGAACQNGGVCVDNVIDRSQSCACDLHYVGDYCEYQNPCDSYPCLNDGTCSASSSGEYSCTCVEGIISTNCEFRCKTGDCLHGGSCKTITGECNCTLGYSGVICEKYDCTTGPSACFGHGTCINGYCDCYAGYTGVDCTAKSMPNIVIIVADDLGSSDVSWALHPSPDIETPFMATLIQRFGMSLHNYYTQPCCTPSRGSLLWSIHETKFRLQHEVIHAAQRNGVPTQVSDKTIVSLPELLKSKGFRTHLIGKWHLGHAMSSYLPTSRGFDTYLGLVNGLGDHYTHMGAETFDDAEGKLWTFSGHDFMEAVAGSPPTQNTLRDGEYSTHAFTDQFETLLADHMINFANQPFFFDVSYSAPHYPLQAPPNSAYTGNDERKLYTAMVKDLDLAVERVYQALVKHDVWNNTILIFTSDNGGDAEHKGNNFPLRGKKLTMWEGGIKSAAFVASPLLKKRPSEQEQYRNFDFLHISDWMVTIAKLVKYSFTEENEALLNGQDLSYYFLDSVIVPPSRNQLFVNIDDIINENSYVHNITNIKCELPMAALIKYQSNGHLYKVITGSPGSGVYYNVPENSSFPVPANEKTNLWFFDLSSDPTEYSDLSGSTSSVVKGYMNSMLDLLCSIQTTIEPANFPEDDLLGNPGFSGNNFNPWVNNDGTPEPIFQLWPKSINSSA